MELDLYREENSLRDLEKLQIGSPEKGLTIGTFGSPNSSPQSSISPVHNLSPPSGQGYIWKDFPYVNHCGSGTMSQKSFSCTGASTNGLPVMSMYSYGPNHPNFNNYRSSAVADIFGGRAKSKTPIRPLISPSRLSSGPVFPNFGTTTAKMSSIGIYYHRRSSLSPEVFNVNLMEDPISRSSSQSSGFISQKELEDQEFGKMSSSNSSPYTNGSFSPYYSVSNESIYSHGPLSMISGGGGQPQLQQIWIGPNHNQYQQEFNRSYGPPTRQSTPVGNWRKGGNSSRVTTPPGVACSRFGPRTSSFVKKSTPSECDTLFSDTDDESWSESFKTAREGSSVHSLHYRRRKSTRIERRMRKAKENTPRECHDYEDDEMKDGSMFVRILFQLIRSISLLLVIVVMFGIFFGSGIARTDFLDAPAFQYFKWFTHVSHNLSHCVRDTVFFRLRSDVFDFWFDY